MEPRKIVDEEDVVLLLVLVLLLDLEAPDLGELDDLLDHLVLVDLGGVVDVALAVDFLLVLQLDRGEWLVEAQVVDEEGAQREAAACGRHRKGI